MDRWQFARRPVELLDQLIDARIVERWVAMVGRSVFGRAIDRLSLVLLSLGGLSLDLLSLDRLGTTGLGLNQRRRRLGIGLTIGWKVQHRGNGDDRWRCGCIDVVVVAGRGQRDDGHIARNHSRAQQAPVGRAGGAYQRQANGAADHDLGRPPGATRACVATLFHPAVDRVELERHGHVEEEDHRVDLGVDQGRNPGRIVIQDELMQRGRNLVEVPGIVSRQLIGGRHRSLRNDASGLERC